MELIRSSVGRKLLMAVTGLMLVGFIVGHLVGNTTIFVGPDGINAYAEKLQSLGPLLWLVRAVLLAVVGLHIVLGIQLTLENRAARPDSYRLKRHRRADLSGRTMIYTGLATLVFIVYHLLHFTFQVTGPGSGSHTLVDAAGRPDVYLMVVRSFEHASITIVYVVAMLVVLLHISHGIQSLLQTFGLTTPTLLPRLERLSTVIAIVIQVGFICIPVSIVLGLVGAAMGGSS
jgi:succinate dehydrogenase / fumarate reductase cytochrome b subunit